MDYYYADANGTQQGPVPVSQLAAKGVRPETLIWADGMAQWQRADSVPEVQPIFSRSQQAPPPPPQQQPISPLNYGGGPAPAPYQYPPPMQGDNNKVAAGLCGILIGALGIHKFILGMTGAGLTMLLISVLSCGILAPVMHIIGLIEGIIYLTKSDAEFYQTYVVQKKSWF